MGPAWQPAPRGLASPSHLAPHGHGGHPSLLTDCTSRRPQALHPLSCHPGPGHHPLTLSPGSSKSTRRGPLLLVLPPPNLFPTQRLEGSWGNPALPETRRPGDPETRSVALRTIPHLLTPTPTPGCTAPPSPHLLFGGPVVTPSGSLWLSPVPLPRGRTVASGCRAHRFAPTHTQAGAPWARGGAGCREIPALSRSPSLWLPGLSPGSPPTPTPPLKPQAMSLQPARRGRGPDGSGPAETFFFLPSF